MSHEDGHPALLRGGEPAPPPLAPGARMKAADEPPGYWENPANVTRLLRVFYALSVGLVLVELVVHRHVAHPWERLFGFHAWYGFAACWILVVLAKRMRRVLMRPEDYYDGD